MLYCDDQESDQNGVGEKLLLKPRLWWSASFAPRRRHHPERRPRAGELVVEVRAEAPAGAAERRLRAAEEGPGPGTPAGLGHVGRRHLVAPAGAQAVGRLSAQSEDRPDRPEGISRYGEARAHALEEGVELGGVHSNLPAPEVVREIEAEPGQQVAQHGVGDRLGGPTGQAGLLGLLEVVGDPAGVEAEQPDLPRLRAFGRGRVAVPGPVLPLECLREADRDLLLRVAPKRDGLARQGDRPRDTPPARWPPAGSSTR